jgi:hypothetical protein
MRITIEKMIEHPWVTNNGELEVDIENVEVFKRGFGNIGRLMETTNLRKQSTNLITLNSIS